MTEESRIVGRRRKWPDDFMQDEPGDNSRGVRCPKCNCPRTKVGYTRHSIGNRNLRRRTCEHCGHQFPTYEKA